MKPLQPGDLHELADDVLADDISIDQNTGEWHPKLYGGQHIKRSVSIIIAMEPEDHQNLLTHQLRMCYVVHPKAIGWYTCEPFEWRAQHR
jgi:hypothetical protein